MEGITPVMNVGTPAANYGDGWGGGCGAWLMWVIVIFAMMGGGWGGFGNRAGLTQAEMQQGFNHQDEMGQLRGVSYGLADSTFSLNTTMLQGQAGLEKTVMQGNYALGSQLAENRFAQQNCCCETNRNIDAVRAEGYRNTCELKTAIHDEAEKTRGMMMASQIQELRDKLADRDRDLQSANFNLSQVMQTSAIVGQLRPFPQPAYITASPYQTLAGYGLCHCSTGTGTGTVTP
jgi:hypothetical protein|nr:MAG TPA_asm: hypothetical protein [Caudoviricetes sp.]